MSSNLTLYSDTTQIDSAIVRMKNAVQALKNCQECEKALRGTESLLESYKQLYDLAKEQVKDFKEKDQLCDKRQIKLTEELYKAYKDLRRAKNGVKLLKILAISEGGMIAAMYLFKN